MANYVIRADLIDNVDWEINSFYVNLSCYSKFFKSLDLETKFGNKLAKHLKSLKIGITKNDLISSFSLIQSTLFSSNNLQEIVIYFSFESDQKTLETAELLRNIKRPTFPALRSFTIEKALNAGSVST